VSTNQVEEDPSLLPPVAKIEMRRSLRYWGTYPDQVFAIVSVGYDENQMDKTFRYLGRASKEHFVATDCPKGCSLLPAFGMDSFGPPESRCRTACEPFDIYAAEERASWDRKIGPNVAVPPPTAMLFGHGGPMLVIDPRKLAVWNGASWDRVAAPWCSVGSFGAVRLSNGSSLVRSNEYRPGSTTSSDCVGTGKALFWVSPSGKPYGLDLSTVAVEHGLGEIRFRAPVELDRQIWLVTDTDAGTALLAPITPSEVTRPIPEVSPSRVGQAQ
jgi:hypothetical protein